MIKGMVFFSFIEFILVKIYMYNLPILMHASNRGLRIKTNFNIYFSQWSKWLKISALLFRLSHNINNLGEQRCK